MASFLALFSFFNRVKRVEHKHTVIVRFCSVLCFGQDFFTNLGCGGVKWMVTFFFVYVVFFKLSPLI